MVYKNLRTVGNVHIDSDFKNGQGSIITNEFFCRLLTEFAKQSAKYMYFTEAAPFVYSERQLHSIIAPALSKITDGFLMESKVKRRWSAIDNENYQDSHGWVDYWCSYRNISYFIELKHGFISSISGQVRKYVKQAWKTAKEQLDAIEKEVKDEAELTNGAFRVALTVLPIYEVSNTENPKTINQLDRLLKIQSEYKNNFEPVPNWTGLWVLHKDLVGPYRYLNAVEYYPGLLFMAKISEIYT